MPEDPPAAALTSFDRLLFGIAAPTHRARYNLFDISLEIFFTVCLTEVSTKNAQICGKSAVKCLKNGLKFPKLTQQRHFWPRISTVWGEN